MRQTDAQIVPSQVPILTWNSFKLRTLIRLLYFKFAYYPGLLIPCTLLAVTHRVYGVPGFLSSSELGPSPPPPQASVPPLPTRVLGGATLACGGRGWEDPIPTKGETLWNSMHDIIPLRSNPIPTLPPYILFQFLKVLELQTITWLSGLSDWFVLFLRDSFMSTCT